MKQIKMTLLIVTLVSVGFSQMLSLEQCFQMAEKNHPIMKQKSPINEITKKELQNINTKWLPTLDLNLSATYQSDVTSIDVNLPAAMAGSFNIPSPDKDNYKSEIEINQLIFDGGLVAVHKELIKQDNKISVQQLETNFQVIKNSITNVYYNLLILDAQKIILECWTADLENSKATLTSHINSGIADRSSIYEIDIKLHELSQQSEENKIFRENNLEILSELVGEKLDNMFTLYIPTESKNSEIFNAQSILFDYQMERLDIAKKSDIPESITKSIWLWKGWIQQTRIEYAQ